MAGAATTETFNCTNEQFFNLIADFESYPKFISELKQVKILKEEGGRKLVEFQASVVKTFTYRLWVTENRPTHMHWELESGDIFKTSTGSWDLKEVGGKTEAKYAVDASFKVFVPGMIAKALVNVNLPGMMRAYHALVKEKYGRG